MAEDDDDDDDDHLEKGLRTVVDPADAVGKDVNNGGGGGGCRFVSELESRGRFYNGKLSNFLLLTIGFREVTS